MNAHVRPPTVNPPGGLMCVRKPVGALLVEALELGTVESGHVGLDLVTDERLHVGEVAVALGDTRKASSSKWSSLWRTGMSSTR